MHSEGDYMKASCQVAALSANALSVERLHGQHTAVPLKVKHTRIDSQGHAAAIAAILARADAVRDGPAHTTPAEASDDAPGTR